MERAVVGTVAAARAEAATEGVERVEAERVAVAKAVAEKGEGLAAEKRAAEEKTERAREAAAKSIVLLRNETVDGTPVLPLDPATLRSIAVITAA